jgi:recombination protein RecA
MWGNAEVTPGGNALKFYSSIRIDVRRISSIKKGNDTIGNKTRIKIIKNKVAPPFKEVVINIIFGEGIDHIKDVLDLAVDLGIIQKSAGWYTYKDAKFLESSLKEHLYNNKEEFKNLKDEVLQRLEDLDQRNKKMKEDIADEDIADEDIADEDIADEDIADEDIADEDIVE